MARISDDTVVEILKPIAGFDIADCFHPDILAGCIACGDDVKPGWILTTEGLVDPDAVVPAEEAPVEEAPVEEAPADTPPAA